MTKGLLLLGFAALCFSAGVAPAHTPPYKYPGPPAHTEPYVPCGEEYDNLVDKKGIAKKVFTPGQHQVLCIDEESDIIDRKAIADKIFGRRKSHRITVNLASSDFEFLKLYVGTPFSVKLKQEPGTVWKYTANHWIDYEETSDENPVKNVGTRTDGKYFIMDFDTSAVGYTYLYFDKFDVTKDTQVRLEGRAIRARIQKPKPAVGYLK